MASTSAGSSRAGASAPGPSSNNEAPELPSQEDHQILLDVVAKRMVVAPMKATLNELKGHSDFSHFTHLINTYGRKQNLIDRLLEILRTIYASQNRYLYHYIKGALEFHYGSRINSTTIRRGSNYYPPNGSSTASATAAAAGGRVSGSGQTLGAAPSQYVMNAAGQWLPSYAVGPYATSINGYPAASTSASTSAQHNALLAHRSSAGGAAHVHLQQQQQQQQAQGATFRKSPFFSIVEWVSKAVQCPPLTQAVRHQPAAALVELTQTQCGRLQQRSPATEYHLRLFCTTMAASQASIRPMHPAPIEFPLNSHVRVNHADLSVNLRGKKTAAKVLPPNLNKDKKLNLTSGRNVVEMFYNSAPVPYIIAIAICEYHSPDSLAENIRKSKLKSKEEVLGEMKRAADDDDIEVGQVTINLKCPLSYMRLSTPCRSNVCNHIQCFDALSFYSLNEQTPSWQCPICSKTVDPDTLFLDGYVQNILQRVPEEQEHINIDSEGRWWTPDKKFSSDDTFQDVVPATNGVSQTPGSGADDDTSLGNGSAATRVKGEDSSVPPPAWPTANIGEPQSNGRKEVEFMELEDSPTPPAQRSEPAPAPGRENGGTSEGGPAGESGSGAQPTLPALPSEPRVIVLRGSSTTSAGGSHDTHLERRAASPMAIAQSSGNFIDLTWESDDEEDIPVRRNNPPPAPPPRPLTIAVPPRPSPQLQAPGAMSAPFGGPVPSRPVSAGNRASGLQPLDRFLVPKPPFSAQSALGQDGQQLSIAGAAARAQQAATPTRGSFFAPRPYGRTNSASSVSASVPNGRASTGIDSLSPAPPLPPHSRANGSGLTPTEAPASTESSLTPPPGRFEPDRRTSASSVPTVQRDITPNGAAANGRESTPNRENGRRRRSEEMIEEGEGSDEGGAIRRPHKRLRSAADMSTAAVAGSEEDDEFADLDLDLDLDLDPSSGLSFTTPPESASSRSNGHASREAQKGSSSTNQASDGSDELRTNERAGLIATSSSA